MTGIYPEPVTSWSAGRYEAVATLIAPIAAEVIAAAAPGAGTALVDLACRTGNAALVAAASGAEVTGVDLTAELLAIAAAKPGGSKVSWVAADASATGLPDASFDAAVSNMGIIFVDPLAMVAELARLLKPGGVLAFSRGSGTETIRCSPRSSRFWARLKPPTMAPTSGASPTSRRPGCPPPSKTSPSKMVRSPGNSSRSMPRCGLSPRNPRCM
jgi:SAM-dependent methyltransferase